MNKVLDFCDRCGSVSNLSEVRDGLLLCAECTILFNNKFILPKLKQKGETVSILDRALKLFAEHKTN